jgi:hypothetical protein
MTPAHASLRENCVLAYWAANRLSRFSGLGTLDSVTGVIGPPPVTLGTAEIAEIRRRINSQVLGGVAAPAGSAGFAPGFNLSAALTATPLPAAVLPAAAGVAGVPAVVAGAPPEAVVPPAAPAPPAPAPAETRLLIAAAALKAAESAAKAAQAIRDAKAALLAASKDDKKAIAEDGVAAQLLHKANTDVGSAQTELMAAVAGI